MDIHRTTDFSITINLYIKSITFSNNNNTNQYYYGVN